VPKVVKKKTVKPKPDYTKAINDMAQNIIDANLKA